MIISATSTAKEFTGKKVKDVVGNGSIMDIGTVKEMLNKHSKYLRNLHEIERVILKEGASALTKRVAVVLYDNGRYAGKCIMHFKPANLILS